VTVAGVITVIEIGGLLAVVGWAALGGRPVLVPPSDLLPPLEAGAWAGIGAASLLAFFAFIGFEDMVNVAEEVRDPVRAMPRAILATLVLATALYVLTAGAVVMTVPLAELAGSAAPLALVFAEAPAVVADAFALVAIVATVNGILIQMIMASRVIYGLADRKVLPRFLSRVSARTRTPGPATALVAGVIVLLTLSLPIDALAQWTSQIVLSVFVIVNLALIRLKLRGTRPEGRHFHVPLAVPVLGVGSSLLLFAAALL
jgi:amino acid transporter